MNTNIFRNMSYGVYIVGTMDGNRPTGCVANSIMQITSSPATVALSMNHDNYTNQCIEKSGIFSFSILAEGSPADLVGTFGFQSGKDVDKFANVEHELIEGVPVVKNTCGYVVCKLINKMETSTHTVFLGEVIAAEPYENTTSKEMTYSYYHKVVKGKSPKNAPTYLPETEAPTTASNVTYVCQVCGYVYEGDPLPADFICPICKQGADKFKRVEG